MTRNIYKILTTAQWEALCADLMFTGAPIDVADGYIHFSTAAQAKETADKHFSAYDSLILARCDADDFGKRLKWEVSRGGDLFPHLYDTLPLGAIDRYWSLNKTQTGFVLPDDVSS